MGQPRCGPRTVASPYGDATVTDDDHGVPPVEADTEAAACFAVSYAQAADRLFEVELVRRLKDGRLAEAVGERAVESDVFNCAVAQSPLPRRATRGSE